MKIIFLDFDGVLAAFPPVKWDSIDRHGYPFTPNCVLWFNKLIEETGAKVAISSSWQASFDTIEDVKECLANRGIKCEIHESFKTRLYKINTGYRGFEIDSWLRNNEFDKFVIIEDEMYDMLYIHKDNIVECDPKKGFGEIEFMKARYLLMN